MPDQRTNEWLCAGPSPTDGGLTDWELPWHMKPASSSPSQLYRYRINQFCSYLIVQERTELGRWKRIDWWRQNSIREATRRDTAASIALQDASLNVAIEIEGLGTRISRWDSAVVVGMNPKWFIAAYTSRWWAGTLSLQIYSAENSLMHLLRRGERVIGNDQIGCDTAHVWFNDGVSIELAIGFALFWDTYLF